MTIEIVRVAFGYAFALVVFGYGGFFFFAAFLDPNYPPLEQNGESFAIALIGFMGAALQWVFGTATAAATTRQQQSATDAGAAAGAMVPGQTTTITEQPPMQVTTGPNPPPQADSRPCLDCGLSAQEHADVTDHIYRPI